MYNLGAGGGEEEGRKGMGNLGGGFGKPGAPPPSPFIPLFALNLTTPPLL